MYVTGMMFSRRWSEVAPAAWPLDADHLRELVSAELERLGPPSGPDDRDAIEAAVDRALIAELGIGVCGWRWAASEPGGGGPVRGWCCARDSLYRTGEPDASESLDRIVAAVQDWRELVTRLEREYEELWARTGELAVEEMLEQAAAALLPLILERTAAEDAWYATLARLLGWFLEAVGEDVARYQAIIERVISGRFASWIAPDDEQARAAFAELRAEVGRARTALPPPPDALAAWLAMRHRVSTIDEASESQELVRSDGHRRFVKRELARDGTRAARFTLALDECRASALRGESLDFARLRAWQALVLGDPEVDFRDGDAYAKAGRERYPLARDTFAKFVAALAEAHDAALPPVLRAARVYLDVSFFHPFADGNARAARLALDHVLTRAGLGLHSVEPLFSVARAAGDKRGVLMMTIVLKYLSGPIAY